MKFRIASVLIFALNCGLAKADVIQLEGSMSLWSSIACDGGRLCQIPEPLAPAWTVRLEFEKPVKLGRHIVADKKFGLNDWNVRLTQTWAELKAPEVSYIVTQIELDYRGRFIALCTRYDATDAFKFLPPGACSGSLDNRIIGVSISQRSPYSTVLR